MLKENEETTRQSVVDTLAGLARYGEHNATANVISGLCPLENFREELSKADHHDIRHLPNRLLTDNVDVRRSLLKVIIALANFGESDDIRSLNIR